MKKRTFSKEEKLAIIKEASIHGVTSTLEKHGVYPGSYYIHGRGSMMRWAKKALITA